MASGTIVNTAVTGGAGYCKLPDGTMIQWGQKGGISFSGEASREGTVDFGVSFYSAPVVCLTPYSTSVAQYAFRATAIASTGSNFSWVLFTGDNSPATINNRGFSWIAVGRWKA